MSTKTELLSLNDDALLCIFSLLYGKEALGIALTSKRLHDLAIPRVAAVAKCASPNDFPPLCVYMLQSPQPRARHLEILDIRLVSFHGPQEAKMPYDHRIINLLEAARNLRQLALSCRPRGLDVGSRIWDALVTMRNLTDLHLGYVDGHALALLPMLSGSLRHLKLWYSIRPAQSTSTDDALLCALATHTRLQRLELMGFAPSEPFAHADTQYTSLRHLVLTKGNALSLQLPDHFPQLTTLAVSVRGPTFTDPHVATASRWPPLKTLLIQSTLDRDIQNRIGRVDKLVLQQSMQPGELDAPLASQGALTGMAILRAASPVYLSLSVYLSLALMDVLAHVLADLPRLRMLDLQRVASSQNTMEPPLHEKLVSPDAACELGVVRDAHQHDCFRSSACLIYGGSSW